MGLIKYLTSNSGCHGTYAEVTRTFAPPCHYYRWNSSIQALLNQTKAKLQPRRLFAASLIHPVQNVLSKEMTLQRGFIH